MKKLLILLIAAVMLLALLAGCVKISTEDIANTITDYVIDKIDESTAKQEEKTSETEDAAPPA
ncbi:MAG: hypothetical protein IKR95_00580, partial [Oscillospiraceae bacterium]|nr:hypothetical protein [Oscillospiraceae bacterium]